MRPEKLKTEPTLSFDNEPVNAAYFFRVWPERQRLAGIEATNHVSSGKTPGVKNETGAVFYFKTLSRRDGGAPGKGIDKKYAAFGETAARHDPITERMHCRIDGGA
jgi:hypothetical protein